MFRHTERTDKIIRDGYANATPVREIAAALGVSRNVVIGRARRIGLADPDRQPTYSETVRQLAVNEYRRGRTLKQVAAQFGVSQVAVGIWSRTR
jgi:hypothetical protein